MTERSLLVNGFEVRAAFAGETVSGVLLPLLGRLAAMSRQKAGRLVVYLAAPPACGKSTLAAFLEILSRTQAGLEPLQALGIDGFHYPKAYVLTHTVRRDGRELPMKDVKGCPESYDAPKLRDAVSALLVGDSLWPAYDRRLHDVVEGAVAVRDKIVLIEGNWLLLNEGTWAAMKALCDYSVMMRADPELLKARLIARKIRGGLSPGEAERFYEESDGPNVLRCLGNSVRADLALTLRADGVIERE